MTASPTKGGRLTWCHQWELLAVGMIPIQYGSCDAGFLSTRDFIKSASDHLHFVRCVCIMAVCVAKQLDGNVNQIRAEKKIDRAEYGHGELSL